MGRMLIQDHMGVNHILHFVGEIEGEPPGPRQEVRWEKDGKQFTARTDDRPMAGFFINEKSKAKVITAYGGPRHSTEYPFKPNIELGTYLEWEDVYDRNDIE